MSHSTNIWHERERQKCECDCVGGSHTRLPVPLFTTRAPWDPQLSWTWQTSCDGRTLCLSDARHAAQAVTVDDTNCQESVLNWDGRLLVRILRLWHLMLRHLGFFVLFFEEIREHVWWVLVHRNVVCFSRVCIFAELWRGKAAVMLEEGASNVARCGQSKDVCSLCVGANDVGPCCCVVTHRGNLLQRVVGPAHDEAAHASNAVGEAGNVVGMVLDLPTNVTCRVPAQRGLEGSHIGSVQRLAHGRGVGRHEDEPDVGMRLPMVGQELLADVHDTHVHEADPCGAAAIGVHDSGVQPCEEGCEGVVVVQWLSAAI